MSIMKAFGAAPVLTEKEEQEQKELKLRQRRAKLLMKKGSLRAAAEELVGGVFDDTDDIEDIDDIKDDDAPKQETKSEQSSSAEETTSSKASDPTAADDTSEKTPTATAADDFISSFEETASNEVKPMANPVSEAPLTEVAPPEKPNKLPTIREAIAEADEEAASDEAARAHARSTVTPETKAPIVQEEEIMIKENRSFYNEELGDAAYRFDGNIDKEPAPILRDYVKSVIARDPQLIDEVIKDYLPDIIGKNPQMIPDIMQMIRDAEDKNIPIRALYINAKDPESQEEYDTWEAATASIAKEINTYGVDPTTVFKTIWREVLPDGNLGNQLGQSEVVDYIENHYHGDKEKIKKLLRVKYSADSGKQANSGKTNSGKQAKKPAKKANNGTSNTGAV